MQLSFDDTLTILKEKNEQNTFRAHFKNKTDSATSGFSLQKKSNSLCVTCITDRIFSHNSRFKDIFITAHYNHLHLLKYIMYSYKLTI